MLIVTEVVAIESRDMNEESDEGKRMVATRGRSFEDGQGSGRKQ